MVIVKNDQLYDLEKAGPGISRGKDRLSSDVLLEIPGCPNKEQGDCTRVNRT